jgi:glutathione S-transferase
VVASAEIQTAKDFKLKNITGELPMLETEDGTITEQIAIIKFLARKA